MTGCHFPCYHRHKRKLVSGKEEEGVKRPWFLKGGSLGSHGRSSVPFPEKTGQYVVGFFVPVGGGRTAWDFIKELIPVL